MNSLFGCGGCLDTVSVETEPRQSERWQSEDCLDQTALDTYHGYAFSKPSHALLRFHVVI